LACASGKFAATGSTICTDCAAGKYFAATGGATAAACTSCGADANAPVASIIHTACTCNAGYYGAALTAAGSQMSCTVIIRSAPCCMFGAGVAVVSVAFNLLACSDPAAAPSHMCATPSRHVMPASFAPPLVLE
jgi:hypothetical protein